MDPLLLDIVQVLLLVLVLLGPYQDVMHQTLVFCLMAHSLNEIVT